MLHTLLIDILVSVGVQGTLAAVGLYVLLRGEVVFRYPARRDRPQEPPR